MPKPRIKNKHLTLTLEWGFYEDICKEAKMLALTPQEYIRRAVKRKMYGS